METSSTLDKYNTHISLIIKFHIKIQIATNLFETNFKITNITHKQMWTIKNITFTKIINFQ